MPCLVGVVDPHTDAPAAEEMAMESSVISRHWPACSDRIRLTVDDVTEGRLRGIIRDLRDLRTHRALTRTVDAKLVSALDTLCEAEEAQRTAKA